MTRRTVLVLAGHVAIVHLGERAVVVAGLVAMTLTADVVQVPVQSCLIGVDDSARQIARTVTQCAQFRLQRAAAQRRVAGTAVQRITPRLDAVVDGLIDVHRNTRGVWRHIRRVAGGTVTHAAGLHIDFVQPQADRHRAAEAAGAEELERGVADQGVVGIAVLQLAPVFISDTEAVSATNSKKRRLSVYL